MQELLNLCLDAVDDGKTWQERRRVMKSLAVKLGEALKVAGEYQPITSMELSWTKSGIQNSIIKVLQDKPSYLRQLDQFSQKLIDQLSIEKIPENTIKTLLGFIQGFLEAGTIHLLNHPLIKRLVFILAKISEMSELRLEDKNSSDEKKLSFADTSKLLRENIRSAGNYFRSNEKDNYREKIESAVAVISSDEKNLEKLVESLNRPEYLYIIALIGLHGKFEENNQIRNFGFKNLCSALKLGVKEALELMQFKYLNDLQFRFLALQALVDYYAGRVYLNNDNVKFTKYYFTELQNYQAQDEQEFKDLIKCLEGMVLGAHDSLRGLALTALMDICMRESSFSHQHLVIMSLRNIYLVRGVIGRLASNYEKFKKVWEEKSDQGLTMSMIAVLRADALHDQDSTTHALISELEKNSAQDATIIISIFMKSLSDFQRLDLGGVSRANRIFFILEKIADMPQLELSARSENNNNSAALSGVLVKDVASQDDVAENYQKEKQKRHHLHLQNSFSKQTDAEIEEELKLALLYVGAELANDSSVKIPGTDRARRDLVATYIKTMGAEVSLKHCYIFIMLLTDKKPFNYEFFTLYRLSLPNNERIKTISYLNVMSELSKEKQFRCRALLGLLDHYLFSELRIEEKTFSALMDYKPADQQEMKRILDYFAFAGVADNCYFSYEGIAFSDLPKQGNMSEDMINTLVSLLSSSKLKLLVALAERCLNNEETAVLYVPQFIRLEQQYNHIEKAEKPLIDEFFKFFRESEKLQAELLKQTQNNSNLKLDETKLHVEIKISNVSYKKMEDTGASTLVAKQHFLVKEYSAPELVGNVTTFNSNNDL